MSLLNITMNATPLIIAIPASSLYLKTHQDRPLKNNQMKDFKLI